MVFVSEYVILSKASNIRSLDLSQCVRSVEELAAMIAGLIIVCREERRVWAFQVDEIHRFEIYSSITVVSIICIAGILVDLRMRSELQVNVKDEDGEYTELEYVFD